MIKRIMIIRIKIKVHAVDVVVFFLIEPRFRFEPTLRLAVDEGLELSRLARGFLAGNLRTLGFG